MSNRAFAFPVQTDEENAIECQMSEDKSAANLTCDKPFALFDDKEILRKMKVCAFDESDVDEMLEPHLATIAKKYKQEHSRHITAASVDHSAESDLEDRGATFG